MKEQELKKEIEEDKIRFLQIINQRADENVVNSWIKHFIKIGKQQGKSEVSSGKFAVKLVEQGKEIGKSEAVKDEIKFLEKLRGDDKSFFYKKLNIRVREIINVFNRDIDRRLQELKQKLKNLK